VRIGLARDRAFGFYYADDLAALEAAGAQLVPIDTLRDRTLPDIDGLVIGGGFPEVFMAELEANAALRHALRDAIAAGLPTYAECGGLMYLARAIRWGARRAEMVGAIAGEVTLHARPVGRGYVRLEVGDGHPWGLAPGTVLHGHEFHHSSLDGVAPGSAFAYRVRRGHGVDGVHDGVVVGNLVASYSHLRTGAGSDWAPRFVDFVRRCRARAAAPALALAA